MIDFTFGAINNNTHFYVILFVISRINKFILRKFGKLRFPLRSKNEKEKNNNIKIPTITNKKDQSPLIITHINFNKNSRKEASSNRISLSKTDFATRLLSENTTRIYTRSILFVDLFVAVSKDCQ